MARSPINTSAVTRMRTPKTSEFVARDLATHIVGMKLPEGTRLPIERELLDKLGVGRSTLREALRLLETRGVITIRSGRQGGPVVRRPKPTDLSESLALLLSFESVSLSDVLEAREAFEPMIAKLAARNATKAQIAVMRETIDTVLANSGDHVLFMDQTAKYLSTMAAAAGNSVLKIICEALLGLNYEAVSGVEYNPRRHRQVEDAHSRILDALAAKDEARAESEMMAHRRETSRHWRTQHAEMFGTKVVWTELGQMPTSRYS